MFAYGAESIRINERVEPDVAAYTHVMVALRANMETKF
jgi:hypothetical protein